MKPTPWKRFLVLKCMPHDQSGMGWSSFVSAHDTIQEAETARRATHSVYELTEIVDLERLEVVIEEYCHYGTIIHFCEL